MADVMAFQAARDMMDRKLQEGKDECDALLKGHLDWLTKTVADSKKQLLHATCAWPLACWRPWPAIAVHL